jgi:peptide/nickel transport system substrate-binding protein
MDSTRKPQPFRKLITKLENGDISRRHFLEAAGALGISASVSVFMANVANARTTGQSMRNGFAFYAQGATPEAGAGAIPTAGMENVTRGEGGELRIIQWQAATTANLHTATGTKDFLISDMILEPLMRYLPDGTIIPYLVNEVPSVENGLLAEDLTSATFNLKEGVTWSDGKPFTSKDVAFTWQWVTTEANASVNFLPWSTIDSIDTPDDLTAVVNFKAPVANWFEPLVGGTYGSILPSHVFGDDAANRNVEFDTNPIGTGPFKIDSFSPNDQVTLSMNESYWQPNAPYFASVIVKGGGDAASAARAVVQTGEYEYAWNLQVEPAVLEEMTQGSDARGQIVTVLGTSVERIHINFSDPNTEVDGQRSEVNTPHPFLSDPAVRQAMNKAVDRQTIADEFYGFGQPPTPNILTGLEIFESPNTSWEFNLEAAAQILEDAGWVMDGDTRAKDGVALELTYATSVNQVRQKTQAVVKDAFEQIGIATQLEQIDAGIYFGGESGNDQNINHMYWDISMYTNNPVSPIPTTFFTSWYAGDPNNVAQESNGWQGQNYQRYVNPEFDALYDELLTMTDPEQAYEQLIAMNDVLINDVVIIPEVNRAADTYAISSNLNNDNIAIGPFEINYWNIANWNRPAE